MKIYILLFGLLLFIAGCDTTELSEITSFEECVEAGNPVMESHPRQCAANGEVFVEQLIDLECEEFETYCPSLDECVTVWNTECPEYIEYYQEPQPCTMEYAPVCGEMTLPGDEVVSVDFGNRCVAEVSGAENIRDGYCNATGDVPQDLMEACEYFGGNPVEEHGECEYISGAGCSELGGEFLECESACRHHTDFPDVICTLQCVPVCDLNT